MSAILIEGLKKSYKKTVALENISLSVGEGELYGLIGPDGAGKTSMIRILTSMIYFDEGNVKVLGLDPIRDYKVLRKKIGYMPGKFSLYQDLSVEENLSLFASIFETTIKENYHLIEDIYKQIEPFKTRKAGALSGGMKQKLALCCAMIHKPDILFLDEPTTGVDPVSRKEFWEMLKKLNSDGLTIFVSTPYMDEASLCDRVSLIQEGRLLATETPYNITKLITKAIYAIKGGNMYQLIQAIKKYERCGSAYSFGSEMHYMDREQSADIKDLEIFLKSQGQEGITIKKIPASVEDTFIELMQRHD